MKKDIIDAILREDEIHKPNVTWALKIIEHFIQAILDEVLKKNAIKLLLQRKNIKFLYLSLTRKIYGNLTRISLK